MSHIVTIKTQVRDANAVRKTCVRLNLEQPVQGTFKLFNAEVSGHAVRLRDWKYPLVCQLDTGQLHYDNFGGRWGKTQWLDEFMQTYAIEKTKLEARKQGHTAAEKDLADGSVKITINVGGVA